MANLITFINISCGIFSIYFLTHQNFLLAALFAWTAGFCDIFDGKVARKYKLSTEFGIQLDSFADFLSFVIVPIMFIYFGIIDGKELDLNTFLIVFICISYVINGLRRLIQFNINAKKGEVEKYFIGVPTPLGAIFLWLIFLGFNFGILDMISFDILRSEYIALFLTFIVGLTLNSKIKIKHP